MKTSSKNIKVTTGLNAGGWPSPNHSRPALAVKSNVKAGDGIVYSNHSRRGIAVKTNVKAGGWPSPNHSRRGLAVKTNVKAGGWPSPNHSRRGLAVKSNIKAGEGIVYSNHSRRLA